ncbi:MAG: hypothetical protein IPL61_20510 [Myxococcales bacterium]|nr:hypothetical protein [Myxococcales bacterium]
MIGSSGRQQRGGLVLGGLAVAGALGASGCALVDGLGGGGDDDDVLPTCTAEEVGRGVNYPTDATVEAVTLINAVTHASPWQVAGELRHGDVTGYFSLSGENPYVADLSSDFNGQNAVGDWIIVLRDTEPGDEGTWDSYEISICAPDCASGSDLTVVVIPDCVPDAL